MTLLLTRTPPRKTRISQEPVPPPTFSLTGVLRYGTASAGAPTPASPAGTLSALPNLHAATVTQAIWVEADATIVGDYSSTLWERRFAAGAWESIRTNDNAAPHNPIPDSQGSTGILLADWGAGADGAADLRFTVTPSDGSAPQSITATFTVSGNAVDPWPPPGAEYPEVPAGTNLATILMTSENRVIVVPPGTYTLSGIVNRNRSPGGAYNGYTLVMAEVPGTVIVDLAGPSSGRIKA